MVEETYLGPFRLFDRGVEPFVPAGLALLGSLADEERRDAGPGIGEQAGRCEEGETYHWFLPYFAMAAFRTSSSVFCGMLV